MNFSNSRDTKLILQVAAGILLAFSILWIAFLLSAAPLRQSFGVAEGPVTVLPDPQSSLTVVEGPVAILDTGGPCAQFESGSAEHTACVAQERSESASEPAR